MVGEWWEIEEQSLGEQGQYNHNKRVTHPLLSESHHIQPKSYLISIILETYKVGKALGDTEARFHGESERRRTR